VRYLSLILLLFFAAPAGAALQSPKEFLGQGVGEDRQLFSWDSILSYLDHLDAESDRIELLELGQTTEGRRFVMAVVADEQGLRDKDRIREQARELYQVRETDEARAREIASGGRAILAFSLGVHSTEVGAPQASMEMLYLLVSAEDPVTVRARKELLVLMVPCMNPDGLDLVRDWYMETLGTQAEGTRPLELYHPYAGHDNNRDGFFNNLAETRMWSQVLYHDWLPQMVIDEHQMGTNGPRLFLPPFADPVSPTVHPLVYSQLSAAGQQAVSDLTAEGWTGVVTSAIFTAEWPGSVRSTGFWHNMLGVLSEVASARLATPLFFPEGALDAPTEGPSAYERRANFLAPWPGGWWRLRDIVDIETDLTWAFLRWASDHSEDLLLNFWRMNRDAVAQGESGSPYAFVIPPDQIDSGSAGRIAGILRSGGVELHRTSSEIEFGDHRVQAGAIVVRCDQPFRPFVMEMLGQTVYPKLVEKGETIRPYDVTAWRLSELLGVRTLEVHDRDALAGFPMADDDASIRPRFDGDRAEFPVSDLASNGAANAALAAGYEVGRQSDGDFVVKAPGEVLRGFTESFGAAPREVGDGEVAVVASRVRVGIYSPWGGSMDEGWTRLILDRYGFTYERIRPGDPELDSVAAGRRLRDRFEVLLFPSISPDEMNDGRDGVGKPRIGDAVWPVKFRRGIGAEAGVALRAFVEAGGRVIAISGSTPWLIEAMGLPVRASGGGEGDAYAPGTLLKVKLSPDSHLTAGMGPTASAYYANGYSFSPQAWPEPTRVAAKYAEQDLLVAGFLDGAGAIAGQAAVVVIPIGDGEVVLFGFHPQRRAQTEGTFKLLFNALWPDPR
jgi:hypothetical protein